MPGSDPQWLVIDDFSPGIYSAPGARSAFNTGFASRMSSAPLGAANIETYGCLPAAGGRGLVPGFYKDVADNSICFAEADLADANDNPPYIVAGLEIGNYPSLQTPKVVGILYRASTTNFMTLKLFRDVLTGSTLMRTVTSAFSAAQYAGITLAFTRMATAAPYTTAGQFVVAYGFNLNLAVIGEVGVFPDPTAPTVTGVATMGSRGMILAHQNRVVRLTGTGASGSFGAGLVLLDALERIDFTDPANSNVMGTQQQAFYPEATTGIAAWASLSASALLLIKRFGGAVLLEGDIAAPRTSILPGVQSAGNIMSRACVSPLGVIYASEGNGVWAWNGGASSVKISGQLDDFFYRHLQTDAVTYFDSHAGNPGYRDGPGFQALYYNDYIFVSGGWMHHIPTGGWWRLDDPTVATNQQMWYGVDLNEIESAGGNTFTMPTLYAMHPKANLVSGTTYRTGYKYYLGKFASTWFWRSHPIKVGDPDSDVNMSEVVVVALRDASGTGTSRITVKVYDHAGTVAQTIGPTTVAGVMKPYRFPLEVHGDFLEFSILAENTTDGVPAPMVSEVRVGYRQGTLQPAQ